MGISLKNKVVLITGASAGIGAATAMEFAKLGARLLLCARRRDLLHTMEPSLLAAGAASVFSFELDVQSRNAVEMAFQTLPDSWSEIDILVNNAGLSRGLNKLYEDDIQNWEEMIDTNVKGLLYVTRIVVPGMVQRGSGHVINLGSIAGHMAYPNGGVYCATKAAERFISDGLRLDLNGTPVRVTSIDPGMVETDFSKVRFRGDEERAAKTYQNIDPLQPEDIADAIAWAATRPAHVGIQTVVLTCVSQANPFVLTRKS
ncbi:SDR family NAD(P)-dependent oxidoreductase [Granulicella mallensis]|uniref:Serine 3-dehydrogenase n=1 Tax=Granulicella mallensis (strain ATCC BAA-1857 / DSM 23137 / MP5ACTX8) TaxID=682795 RepID=G8NSS3_GRAMM|nr:SDR family NAD(P)-dependent oxidoreductase [Granulicella mallensis]AEU35172.1 Serine 3-dehydrogenase [Granulicella mallensis MP5ACTX8]